MKHKIKRNRVLKEVNRSESCFTDTIVVLNLVFRVVYTQSIQKTMVRSTYYGSMFEIILFY